MLDTYQDETRILFTNQSSHDIAPFLNQIKQDVNYVEEFKGKYADLLDMAPHMAVLNINSFDNEHMNLTISYNDTMQHSLPVLANIISNSYLRYDY